MDKNEKDNEKHLRVYLGCLKLVGNKAYSEFTHFAEEFDDKAINLAKNEDAHHITMTREYMLSRFKYDHTFKGFYANTFASLTLNTSGTLLFKNGGRERWSGIKKVMEDLGHIYDVWKKENVVYDVWEI